MSERKVINKYYPPNFDPSKIERRRKSKDKDVIKLQTVRLMTPFSMKCYNCGEYIYKGKKFNARKESTGERYLGIAVIRFHIRCTRCASEITFKTDPKNADYVAERGAARNFEPWRDPSIQDETEEQRLDRLELEQQEQQQQLLDQSDTMAELEAKVVDAKREMEIADALDDLQTRNAIADHINPDHALELARQKAELEQKHLQDQQDEETARLAF
ncbi:CWC16 protein, partial [Lipomyces oligophaga]|uniref:CWC16 protein n=1 Tax=Lipomyces oligophaga TaxID=45792 RepID=UPI0034CDEC0B